MKFCPNCGASLDGQSKFCGECGCKLNLEPVAPVVQEAPPAPPVQTYEPPVQAYVPPVVQEAPPVQAYVPPVVQEAPPAPPVQAYEPPVQAYVPPVQEAPPAQSYAPPAQNYVPPAQSYTPPVQNAPTAKSGGKKSKLPLFIGIGAVAALLVALAVIFLPKLLGGDDPNLGKYECVSISMMGFELTGSDLEDMGESWIELKDGGKLTAMLMGDKVNGTWALDGKKITCDLDGEEAKGTLKDGKLDLTVEAEGLEMKMSFEKEESDKDDEEEKDPNLGNYTCVSISMMGIELTGSDLEDMGESWIELKDGGKCTMMLMDEKVDGTWALDGKKITCDLEGEEVTGTLKDGKLDLTVVADGLEMKMVFEKGGRKDEGDDGDDGFTTPATQAPTVDPIVIPAVTEPLATEPIVTEPPVVTTPPATTAPPVVENKFDWWAGDWYGWWIVADGTGTYSEWIGGYWDAVATITVNPDGTGAIELWDEDGGKDSLIVKVDVEFSEGFSDHGSMISVSGNFLDGRVGYYDWLVDSDGDSVSMFENMICITGTYTDPSSAGTFDYEIYLRPWGMKWEDVALGHAEAPYTDMMSGGYYSWYLPLLEKGLTEAPSSYQAGVALIG